MKEANPNQTPNQTEIMYAGEAREIVLTHIEEDLARFRTKFFDKNITAQLDILHTLATELERLVQDPSHRADQLALLKIATDIHPKQMTHEERLERKQATTKEELAEKIKNWLDQLLNYLSKIAPDHAHTPEEFILDRRRQAYLDAAKPTPKLPNK